MNRRNFFERLGVGATALAIAEAMPEAISPAHPVAETTIAVTHDAARPYLLEEEHAEQDPTFTPRKTWLNLHESVEALAEAIEQQSGRTFTAFMGVNRVSRDECRLGHVDISGQTLSRRASVLIEMNHWGQPLAYHVEIGAEGIASPRPDAWEQAPPTLRFPAHTDPSRRIFRPVIDEVAKDMVEQMGDMTIIAPLPLPVGCEGAVCTRRDDRGNRSGLSVRGVAYYEINRDTYLLRYDVLGV